MAESANRCIIYKSFVDNKLKLIDFEDEIDGKRLYENIAEKEGIDEYSFRISFNGKIVAQNQRFDGYTTFVSVFIPTFGGKGGFGSMLRAIGAQIEKTTNKEACRDLSGRRLRDINAEKRIKEWISKKAESKREEERRKRAKLEKMREEPKVEFKDEEYFKNREEIPETVENAIEYGLKLERNENKSDENEVKKIVKNAGCLWIGVDIDEDEDDDNEDNTNNDMPSTSGVKRKSENGEMSENKRQCLET
ncbi:hypothetical protein B4U79_06244 [Dinothrombium tinctorium]|uniref:SDE2-like domain-containing protein n=1 Tax=Dinothrombium tinctorium TaxID=1965070 RepID=A0A443RGG7_9ACAR|nr:hypothetical protein B4U79_06244 [Dinothrombium tinctorium]